jgi:hypothetical protein
LGLVFYLGGGERPSTPDNELASAANAITQAQQKAAEMSQQVCEATRARVFRGGQISIADAEGWVVEISLIGAPSGPALAESPVLSEFFGTIKGGAAPYIWQEESHLALTENSEPPVEFNSFSIPGAKAPRPGLTLTFKGSFVENYFDELGRSKFYHFAHGLSSALQPAHAALYARCAHDDIRALGSWFMGNDGPAAATSLVYFLGIFSRPRHVESIHYRAPGSDSVDHSLALASIAQGASHLDRTALATLVGSEGGMALGGADSPVVISFPFSDGNRASRVSRTIARVTSLSR